MVGLFGNPTSSAPRRSGWASKSMRILTSLLVCGMAVLATSCHSLKSASRSPGLPLRYYNAQYDFTFFLPANWRGHSV